MLWRRQLDLVSGTCGLSSHRSWRGVLLPSGVPVRHERAHPFRHWRLVHAEKVKSALAPGIVPFRSMGYRLCCFQEGHCPICSWSTLDNRTEGYTETSLSLCCTETLFCVIVKVWTLEGLFKLTYLSLKGSQPTAAKWISCSSWADYRSRRRHCSILAWDLPQGFLTLKGLFENLKIWGVSAWVEIFLSHNFRNLRFWQPKLKIIFSLLSEFRLKRMQLTRERCFCS